MPKIKNLPAEITENSAYDFSIKESGIYLIEIIASCKNWRQNWVHLFNDDDLAVKIDNIEFPKLNKKNGLLNGEAAWNGNNLKGAKKIGIFVLNLKSGDHQINFIPNTNPKIYSVNIKKIENNIIEYAPAEENKQAEDGNNRQWITIALNNLPLKNLYINAKAGGKLRDRDDIKLIIDGEIQKNPSKFPKYKNWYWAGNLLEAKEFDKELNLSKNLHYIELWADKMPTLENIVMDLGAAQEVKEPKEEGVKKQIQIYDQFHGISDKEDYNRFDKEIIEVVDYWNDFFAKQEYPPTELLDCNLVKAIIYRESRMGYQIGGEIDVMQVGNEGDPALKTLNGKMEEWELINGEEIKLNYHGQAKVESSKDSIYWGVRWLYHKAQGITNNKKRYWRDWKDAVLGYGPGADEYANYIWRIYKDGVDFNGETKNILWINKKGGFAFLKLIITIGVILAIGGLGYYFGIKGYYKEQATNIAKEETSVQEIYETVDKTFLNDFEIYKKGEVQYGDFFKDTLKECERIGCIKQSVVYEKYKIIIENMKNNNHFLSAINSLGAENLFHLNDIDNDGENEIIFLMYDPLNRDNIAISVIDKIDGKFALVEKNIKWGHSGHLAVLDVTGDLKPEIISYISFGKGGESLFIYQYSYPNFKEIFNVNDLLYSEYILSDIDNDKKIEIRVIGQDQDPLNDYRTEIKRIYEYNPMQNSFLLIDSGGN